MASPLKFDPKLNSSFIARYLKNPRLVILVLIFVIMLGINAFMSLPRELNPQINIPIVIVSDVLPGANPGDVESLVTVPIENAINGLENVKTVTSSSQDSVSVTTIEFNSGVDPDKAKSDVQNAVDSVNTLPQDALKPQVQKLDFQNAPVWTFVLTGNTDNGSLFKEAKNLKTQLEDLPEINKADISGLENTEIEITIKPETYATYGLSPFTIMPLVQTGLKSFPAGIVKSTGSSFSLTIDPEVATVDDIRKIKIALNNQQVSLSDIAMISEHPVPDQGQSFLTRKNDTIHRAVTFNIFKSKTVNINQGVKAAENKVNDELKAANGNFQAVTLMNTSDQIDTQFFDLTRDFFITVSLVVLVLFIFLGPRQAIISALSAPLSFLITFIVMQLSGISLNFLSLFSLILSLGLLVDDTVVIISAMSAYYKTRKFTPLEAGLLVWRDFITPVFTTTITTVWAFIPLLLATGIIGEFIKSIPVVVSTSLIASFFVGMFITLPLMVFLLKPNFPKRVSVFLKILVGVIFLGAIIMLLPKGNLFLLELITLFLTLLTVFVIRRELLQNSKNRITGYLNRKTTLKRILTRDYSEGVLPFEAINRVYKRAIERIVSTQKNRRMVLSMVIIFSLFSFLLLPLGFVKSEFFPASNEDILYMSVELPQGSNMDITKQITLPIIQSIKTLKGVKFVSTDLGQTLNLTQGGTQAGGANNALINVNLVDKNQRPESSVIAEELRNKYDTFTTAKVSVVEVSGGPPAGADVQIKLSGDDLGVLDEKANEVIAYLDKQPGLTNIDKSIKPGTGKLSFIPNKDELSQNNIGIDQLGLWLRLYASGVKVDTKKFPGDTVDKDIVLRAYPISATADGIDQIQIPTQSNGNIPLMSLGTIQLKTNPTLITREDGKRTISVTAAIKKGFNLADVNTKLIKYANTKLNLPEGYSWKTGGVNEENNNSVTSILEAMLLSFMLIIVTMVIQFSSFRRALIVMMVIPLSISGVFILFALTGTPLSFPALIGVLALFGIVVKNAILLVDKIVENQKHNLPLTQSIAEASASRLEPITLTSIATILGLIPITLTDPLWRGLGGAIIAGLAFSGIIMLFFIPVMYYMIYQGDYKRKRKV